MAGMPRPTKAEIAEFIENDLGIDPATGYELLPVYGRLGFEFYMLAFRSLHRQEDETWHEDISISVYWPKNEKAPTADKQLRLV